MSQWQKASEMIYCAVCKKIHEEKTIVKKRTLKITNDRFALRKSTPTNTRNKQREDINNQYKQLVEKFNLKEVKIKLNRIKTSAPSTK